MTDLHITGDEAADALLTSDPLALLIGMLLDQSPSLSLDEEPARGAQVAMETAFARRARSGPATNRTMRGCSPG